MKVVTRFLCLLVLLSFNPLAGSKGPTLTTITNNILGIVEEDGRWYPTEGWNCKGLVSGEELKTTVLDKSGKVFAWATWNFNANDDGDWAKVTACDKFFPKGHPQSDYPGLVKFTTGEYKLQITAGKSLIWETPFEVKMQRYGSRDHWAITGPWKDVGYIFTGDYGGVINFWFEGPSDPKWYWENNQDLERSLELKAEIIKDGNVLISEGPAQYDQFRSFPNKVRKFSKAIGDKFRFKDLILSKPGTYKVKVYANNQYKEDKYEILDMDFEVKDGEIIINETMSGETSPATHRFITSGSWYQKGVVKNTIPNYR